MLFWILCSLFMMVNVYGHEILAYGDAIIDYIVSVDDDFLKELKTTRGSGQVNLETFQHLSRGYHTKCAGGSAVNTLKGLALLGHTGVLIGRIGNDLDGIEYSESIRSYGLIPAFSQYDTYTGRVVCMISPEGHRTMRSCIDANVGICGFDVDEALFKGIKLFHSEGYQIPNPLFLKYLFTKAKKAGALVSMDMGCHELVSAYKGTLLDLIEHHLDILFTNCDEAKCLTGLPPEDACKELGKKCPCAVVTCGDQGGYVSHLGKLIHYDAFPAKLVDDTGAGDCFMAGFLHGILNAQPIEECARMGAFVASKIIQLVGAELPKNSILEQGCVGDDHQIGKNLMPENPSNCLKCRAGRRKA